MRKEEEQRRFGPEHWVTLRDTGEHVKVEAWSTIAAAYRVRSRLRGVLLVSDGDLDEVPVHPEVGLGRHWNRCRASGCGAPLTPGLAICPSCQAPTCTCGRCACPPKSARAKTTKPAKARAKKAVPA